MIDTALIGRIVAEAVDEYTAKKRPGVPLPAVNIAAGSPGTAGLSPSGCPPYASVQTGNSRTPGAVRDSAVPAAEILPLPVIVPPGTIPAEAEPGEPGVQNPQALLRMKRATPARIGVGRTGPRLRTGTLLSLRADHAAARDAVLRDVSVELLERLGIPRVSSACVDRQEHITRPDLGRKLSPEAKEFIGKFCEKGRDVQLILADGLSSLAVEANIEPLLLMLRDGFEAKHITQGKPFFVRYGRVAIEDEIAELTAAKLVCILIGERPGLAAAESLSAYLCYEARVGQPESRRTVVSNIHPKGIPAAEAGAYLVDLIEKILQKKASGVEFKR